MTQKQWAAVRDRVADAVAEALDLQEDLVVSEVRTSESMEEALYRLASIQADALRASEIVKSFKPHGPKDWSPKGRR